MMIHLTWVLPFWKEDGILRLLENLTIFLQHGQVCVFLFLCMCGYGRVYAYWELSNTKIFNI